MAVFRVDRCVKKEKKKSCFAWHGSVFFSSDFRIGFCIPTPLPGGGGLWGRKKDERVGDDQKRRLSRTISRGGRTSAGVAVSQKKKKKQFTRRLKTRRSCGGGGGSRKRTHKRPRKCYFCVRSLYDLCAKHNIFIRVYRWYCNDDVLGAGL